MTSLARLFQAELIKWRRNWAFVACLLIPSALVAFLFLLFWFSEDRVNRMGPGFLAWYQINYATWNALFLPSTAALVPWLMWDLEETSRSWKHLLVQPLPRNRHFFIKLISHTCLMLMSQFLFGALVLVGGWVLRGQVPVLDMGPTLFKVFARLVGTSLLAGLTLFSLHTWLSSRFRGLGLALALALGGCWGTTRLVTNTLSMHLSPWGLATQATDLVLKGQGSYWGLTLGSLVCTFLLVTLGFVDFVRQEEPKD